MEATARAWASLDLGALAWNLGQLRRLLPSGCQVMAVVKADAYGHGALPVAYKKTASTPSVSPA